MKNLISLFGSLAFISSAIIPLATNEQNYPKENIVDISKKNISYLESIDDISFDLSPGQIDGFKLPNMLNLFKELQKIHFDTGKKVSLYGMPSYGFLWDNDKEYDPGYLESPAIYSISNLINEKNVEFIGVSLIISATNLRNFTGILQYKVDKINLKVKLFDHTRDYLPIKEQNFKTILGIDYSLS
ncbi:hypothetical protein [Spiroplasma chrysopicola]|uniref:Uncharacterized protein n=1 Tax=Spiroplasma chrysopicola DF-1 TaxID=1276227 RepID=R4UFW6_9MOLU|nr:hypothetical protein [Spiroplasma chrysopicola]AGM25050.1 hypothetical protein SCHRY_v1c04710 [Spiroplasma chrysopicola DF-1]